MNYNKNAKNVEFASFMGIITYMGADNDTKRANPNGFENYREWTRGCVGSAGILAPACRAGID